MLQTKTSCRMLPPLPLPAAQVRPQISQPLHMILVPGCMEQP